MDLFESCDCRKANKKRNKWIKTILTIITIHIGIHSSWINCQTSFYKVLYNDGSLPNGEQCQCGTRRCDQSSGLVCNALQSWCSKSECSKTALRASQKMNPIEQKDENTTYPENTCEKFSPRCKCTRCKTNHYGSKCGKCPSSKLVAWVYDGFLIWFVGLNLFLAFDPKTAAIDTY